MFWKRRPDADSELADKLKNMLIKDGFAVVRNQMRGLAHDGKLIELRRRGLAIRVARDRGTWDIEASGPDRDWYLIAQWRDLIDGSSPSIEVLPLARQAELLIDNLARIDELTSTGEFGIVSRRLLELGMGRMRLLFPDSGDH